MARQYLDIRIAPADIAFGLMVDFEADPHPNKVSLIAGAYRDENGLPWILPSVKEVEHPLLRLTLLERAHTDLSLPRPKPVLHRTQTTSI